MAYGAILGKSTVTQSQLNNAAPYNWLDNSDFTNLVMQAGLNGKHGTTTYMADRWIVTGGTPTYTAGTGVSFNGTIQQKLEFAPTGDVTVIVKTTNGYITSKDSPQDINTQVDYYTNGQVNRVTIDSNGTDTIQWVALYEGNYKDTTKIPAYHPKGYANELAICQRYYIRYRNYYKFTASGLVSATNTAVFPFFLPCQMRTSPTALFIGTLDQWRVRLNNVTKVNSIDIVSSSPINAQITVGLTVTGYTLGSAAILYMSDEAVIDFYADL